MANKITSPREELSLLELHRLKRLLGRDPNLCEEAIIGVLWSERCSYKSTKAHLSKLSPVGLSSHEQDGLIKLEDAYAIALKLGDSPPNMLVREIIALGAKPIAVAQSKVAHNTCSIVVGLLDQKLPAKAFASGVKNRVLVVGSYSAEADMSMPLMLACQTCLKEGLTVGISSVGSAGLALACFTMANRASTGLRLNLDGISSSLAGTSVQEIMLLEHFERLIIIAQPDNAVLIKQIFLKASLICDDIGSVSGDGIIRVSYQGKEQINLPGTLVMENAPRYRRQYQSVIPRAPGMPLVGRVKLTLAQALKKQRCALDLEPALIYVTGLNKSVAVSFLTHNTLIKMNPFEGGKRALCQGILEVSTLGAHAQGIGLSLSFGPPEEEARMSEFKHATDGAAHVAALLRTPIVSTHISVAAQSCVPELSLAVVGLRDAEAAPMKQALVNQILVTLGDLPTDFCGTEGLFQGSELNPALLAWELEGLFMLCEVTRLWAQRGKSRYIKAIGQGGLYCALQKIMIEAKQGIRLDFGAEWLSHELLLGLLSEDSPRVVLSLAPEDLPELISLCAQKVRISLIGQITTQDFQIYHQDRLVYETKNPFENDLRSPAPRQSEAVQPAPPL